MTGTATGASPCCAQVHGHAVQQVLAAQGEGLVRGLLRALCDTGPRRHLRALAGCLYQLLSSPWASDAALQWLVGALRAPDLPGVLPR